MQVPPLRRAAHLVRRFFQVAFARALTTAEISEVDSHLDDGWRALFRVQDDCDQRHAHTVMRRVAAGSVAPDVIAAALLHDVGKAGLGMGALARTLATVLDAVGLPLSPRMSEYRNHGRRGAALLEERGAPSLVVDFAGRHPDPDPGDHDPATWSLLLAADHT